MSNTRDVDPGCLGWLGIMLLLLAIGAATDTLVEIHKDLQRIAQAIEAQRATTTKIGVVHESAVPEGNAP